MGAATLLLAAMVGAFAVLTAAALALGGSDSLFRLASHVPGGGSVVRYQPPAPETETATAPGTARSTTPDAVIEVHPKGAAVVDPAGDSLTIELGRIVAGAVVKDAVSITNTTSETQLMRLAVENAPGVSATFASGATSERVAAGATVRVTIASDASHAGVIDGELRVYIGGQTPVALPLAGAQAPAAVATVAATAATGGTVDLSWSAAPSRGVAGYVLFRAAGDGPFVRVGETSALADEDVPAEDGATYRYTVRAVAAGVEPELLGPAAAADSVVPDATAPGRPDEISAPDVSAALSRAVPVTVPLPAGATAGAIELTDGTTTARAAIAPATGTATVDASALRDGRLAVRATVRDAVGNEATYAAAPLLKDTVAPAAPASARITSTGGVINIASADAVAVAAPVAEPDAQIVVELAADGRRVRAVGAPGAGALTVDAGRLPDGDVAVSAWVRDRVGNESPVAAATTLKDTVAPAPADLTVAAGEQNPEGAVNAATADAVTVRAEFPAPTEAGDVVVLEVAGSAYPVEAGDAAAVLESIDLSDLPDGPLPLAGTITDAAGNATTFTADAVKDTVAPAAPADVTVDGGDAAPAGVVTAATEAAAALVLRFPEPTLESDVVTLDVADAAVTATGGDAELALPPVDLTAVPDGDVPVSGTVADAAGNVTPFTASLEKDTFVTTAVRAYLVAPADHAPYTVSQETDDCVTVHIDLAEKMRAGDTLTVILGDEIDEVRSSVVAWQPVVHVRCIDASALRYGHWDVEVEIHDRFGNVSQFKGTNARKVFRATYKD